MEERVRICAGETSHPLFFQADDPPSRQPAEVPEPPADPSLPLVERWLSDAQRAWEEYQRLKNSGKSSPEA